MCNQPQPKSDPEQDNLRQLPLWARRYAQSRSLGLLVSLAIFATGFAAFAGLGILMATALRAGSMTAVVACGVLLAAFGIFWVWVCLVGMQRWVGAATTRLYRQEGEVTVCPEAKPGPPVRRAARVAIGMAAAAVAAVAAVLLSVVLMGSHIPLKYMQPLSALLVVPFLVVLWARNRRAMSPVGLLWPALYALHGMLVVAGAPIVFTGRLETLNMFLPVFGYGLLTGLVGHLYNRHALARMRQLAASGESDEGGEPA